MGIYSSNRIDGLSPYTENIDFSDPVLLNGPSLMETCIEIHEMDQKMFETLIEFDFMSENNLRTMNESEAIAINEADDENKSESIAEKIKKLIGKAIEGIKSAAASAIAKITQIINSDKHLKKKYDKVLTMDNLEGFKGIKNYALPKDYVNFLKFDYYSGLNDRINLAIKDISDNNDINKSKLNQILNSGRTVPIKAAEYESDGFNDKMDIFIPNNNELNQIKKGFNETPNAIKNIKEMTAGVIKSLNQLKKELKTLERNIKKDNSGKALKYNLYYRFVSATSKELLRGSSIYINSLKRQMSSYRKAYIILGKYAYKKANGKENESSVEEAVDFAISESSDMFVLEM